jgi:hypothetical protein
VKTPADLHSSCSTRITTHWLWHWHWHAERARAPRSLVTESQQAPQADLKERRLAIRQMLSGCTRRAAAELISLADLFDLTPEGVHAWCLSLTAASTCGRLHLQQVCIRHFRQFTCQHRLATSTLATGWITPAPAVAVIEPTASADAGSRSKLRARGLSQTKGRDACKPSRLS